MAAAWLVAALFYGWCVAPRLNLPFFADETYFAMQPVEHLHDVKAALPTIPHPPAYLDILRAGVRHWGWADAQFRWVGVASFLVSMTLLGLLAEKMVAGSGVWAMVLWALHPMAIQGSLILDIDNTIMAPAVLLFLLVLLWKPWPLSQLRFWLLVGLWTLGLWIKVSTSLICAVALAVSWVLSRRSLRDLSAVFGIAAIGTVAWFILWKAYTDAIGANWRIVFGHATASIHYAWNITPLGVMQELALRLMRIGLWWLPGMAIVLMLGIAWCYRLPRGELRWRCGVVLATTLVVAFGYVVVRGTHYTFPKYHYPLLPLAITVAAAAVCHKRKSDARRVIAILLTAILTAVGTWLVGDLLYLLNATLRQVSVEMPALTPRVLRVFLVNASVWVGASLSFMLLGWMIVRKRSLQTVLWLTVAGLLGSALAYDLRQRQAPYATTFCYGRSYVDFARVVERMRQLRADAPGQPFFLPVDVAHQLGITEAQWNAMSQLSSDIPALSLYLLKTLPDPQNLAGLVWSWTYNSATQLALFARQDIQDLLQSHYHAERIGEYTVWWR